MESNEAEREVIKAMKKYMMECGRECLISDTAIADKIPPGLTFRMIQAALKNLSQAGEIEKHGNGYRITC